MKNISLYEKLKDLDIVENFKEYSELIWLRCVKINDQFVDDPQTFIDISIRNAIKIGIFEIQI